MATQYYNAVTHNVSPNVTIYAQDGDVSTKIANPATLPAGGIGWGVAWSPGATHLAVGSGSAPFMQVYSRSGDVLTKLADPATLPTSLVYAMAWSPDGTSLAVGENNSPYVSVYNLAGSTLTKIANPATLPTGQGRGVSWSNDGTYLAVAHVTSPYVTIYSRAGDVLTKLTDPGTLPTGTGFGASFTPDGSYLAITHSTAPFVTMYSRSGSTFTKVTDPGTTPTGTGYFAGWSPDGTSLAVAHAITPFITVYNRSGSTLTKIADPGTLPASTAYGASWSPDGTYLSVACVNTPYVTIYSRAADVLTKLTDPASLPPSAGRGTAYSGTLNVAPTAPTWDAPADNSYNDVASSLLLDWTFTDPDGGDTQSAYALSKSVDGGALSYWNAGTSAWVGAEVENPTATTSVTLASSWAADGESVEYKVKTWDAAGSAGPYGSGLTVNAAAATPPTIVAPATSAVLSGSSADVSWTVAAQAAYQVRVLTSADAELYSTGKVVGALTEVTLGYVFIDGQTGLKVEVTTWNASDVPGIDTTTGISVSFTPPATPVLTVTANAAGYISVAIADPTPTGTQPTVETHDVFVRVAAGGRQSGERTVNDDGIRISTGTVTNGTYLDYAAASGTDFEYRTLARAGTATAYSAWT